MKVNVLFLWFSPLLLVFSANAVNPERAVRDISKYGFKGSMKFCEQKGTVVTCPFTIMNISNKDISYGLGLNHLMINHKGFEYKRTQIIRDDGKKINGIGGGTLLIPGVPRTYYISFVGVKEVSTYLPRVFVQWQTHKVGIKFINVPIKRK